MLIRCVRAIDVTKFALEAFVNDVVLLCGCHLARVLIIVNVDVRKKCWERRAKLEAQATSMTEVVHTLELVTSVCLVEIHRVFWVVCDCHLGSFKTLGRILIKLALSGCATEHTATRCE